MNAKHELEDECYFCDAPQIEWVHKCDNCKIPCCHSCLMQDFESGKYLCPDCMEDATNVAEQEAEKKEGAVMNVQEINERFEHEAEMFRKETGMLPPGKDDARGVDSYEDRCNAWAKWQAEKAEKSNDLISRAAVVEMLRDMKKEKKFEGKCSFTDEPFVRMKWSVPTLDGVEKAIQSMPPAGETEVRE